MTRVRGVVSAALLLLVLSPFLLILVVLIRLRNDRAIEEQLHATLLVTTRPTPQAFTKYSFPPKNMEHMASDTPLLTTLLSGIPKGYLRYGRVLRHESPAGKAQSERESRG